MFYFLHKELSFIDNSFLIAFEFEKFSNLILISKNKILKCYSSFSLFIFACRIINHVVYIIILETPYIIR